jgi:hypothetical protein
MQCMMIAASLVVAGALPSEHQTQPILTRSQSKMNWAPPLPARRAAPFQLCLRGGGLFFGRKKVVVPRFEPPPPYSKPEPKDSAWSDVQVCLLSIARLFFRIIRFLCRLVMRLLVRLIVAAINLLGAICGKQRRTGKPKKSACWASNVVKPESDQDWFEASLGRPVSVASVPAAISRAQDMLPPAYKTPPRVGTTASDALSLRDRHDQACAPLPEGLQALEHQNRLRSCGVALPERMWKRRTKLEGEEEQEQEQEEEGASEGAILTGAEAQVAHDTACSTATDTHASTHTASLHAEEERAARARAHAPPRANAAPKSSSRFEADRGFASATCYSDYLLY